MKNNAMHSVGAARVNMMMRWLGVMAAVVTAMPAAAQCVLEGTDVTMQKVTVRPQGAKPHTVSLAGVSVKATLPTRAGRPAELQIDGVVSFRAETTTLWLTVVKPVVSADGLYELAPGAHLIQPRIDGDQIVASAVMYSDGLSEGSANAPKRIASTVRVPCDAVRAGWQAVDETPQPGRADDFEWFMPKGGAKTLRLRASPKANAAAIVMTSTAVEKVRAEGAWWFVQRTSEDVTVRGWVPASELKKTPEGELVGDGYTCCGDDEGAGAMVGDAFSSSMGYSGHALVRAGAKVFAQSGKGEWGVFTADETVRVHHLKGSKWVEVMAVPGVDDRSLIAAYVPLEMVEFPTDGGR